MIIAKEFLTKRFWEISLSFFIAVSILNFIFVDEFLIYSIWTDRDFTRAANLLNDFQYSGSELSGGGRTPGGWYYYYLFLLMLISKEPLFIYYANLSLSIFSIFLLGRLISKNYGMVAGLLVILLLLSSLEMIRIVTHLWNPSFATAFLVFSYFLFIKIILENKLWFLPVMGLVLALSSQIHMSGIFLLIGFILAILISGIKVTKKIWLLTFLTILLAYAPFIINDALNKFEAIQEIGSYKHLNSDLYIRPNFYIRAQSFLSQLITGLFSPYNRNIYQPFPELFKTVTMLALTSFFFFPFVYFIYKKTNRSPVTMVKTSILERSLVVTTIICVVVISLYSFHPTTRNIMPIIPAIAVICGIGLQKFLKDISHLKSSSYLLLNICLIIWLGFFTFLETVYLARIASLKKGNEITYSDIRNITNYSFQEFGFGRLKMISDMGLYYKEGLGDWKPSSQRYTAIDYYTDLSFNSQSKAGPNDCLLILKNSKNQSVLTTHEIKGLMKSIKIDVEAVDDARIKLNKGFFYIPYQSKTSCMKSFTNGYHLVNEEKELIAALKQDTAGIVKKINNAYFFKLDVKGTPEVKITFSTQEDGSRIFTLIGNTFRGFTGLYRLSLDNPRLIFTREDRKISYLSYFWRGRLGGFSNPVSTPWSTEPLNLIPGAYEVEFIVDDINLGKYSLGGRRLLLDKKLETGLK